MEISIYLFGFLYQNLAEFTYFAIDTNYCSVNKNTTKLTLEICATLGAFYRCQFSLFYEVGGIRVANRYRTPYF